jgi:pimeloyl-ACP methyl ester carboxylesterase
MVIYTRLKTAPPQPEALAALGSTAAVEVNPDPWLTFTPRAETPTAGFILYPGALVDPRAYAPPAQAIAAEGYLVVIVPMPLNLAIFGSGQATAVIEAFPEIDVWAIGGHSLGGTMAARYVAENRDAVSGLALWAAYPADTHDLSGHNLAAASIYGTRDGLVTLADIETSRALLPPETDFVPLEGGNHAQFGWYGPQAGDLPATLSHAEQQAEIVAATVALLEQLE